MKRNPIPLMIILPLLSVFGSFEIYAQLPDGVLPGSRPSAPPNAGGAKSAPSRPAPHTLTLGVEREGKLNPKSSDKNASGNFFEEMILKAGSEDLLAFHIGSDNSDLGLQILDKNKSEIAVAKDPSGYFKIDTPTGGLPANGEYRVRVTGALNDKSAVRFTIKVDRLGLTKVAYTERFTKILANYRENDPTSIDETVTKLEKLAKDDPSLPTAFERLGIIYLEIRKDVEKAEGAMEKAIKANGAAIIQISYDNKWRQMTKLRSGDTGFEDKRIGWLKIQAGQISFSDGARKEMAVLTGQQIKESSRLGASAYNLVKIAVINSRKQYIFAPGTMRQVEADLVVKLIQNHVVGKATIEDRR
jgi:hypothetical protein